MQIIEVHTKSRPSTVLCGAGAAEAASEYLRGAQVFVVTDSNVARLYSEKIGKLFPGAPVCVIPAGERHKNRTGLFRILDGMLNARLHRSSVVVAFGGGVVGDMAGLAAALYMRGTRIVQMPTTLLAQVDSSVGGKTAVDYRGVKNVIGAFYQPERVFCDPLFFETLPAREIRCGLGEVIKTGLLDETVGGAIRANTGRLRDLSFLHSLAADCVRFKAGVVERDETESSGLRKCLNLGHTTGHALELLCGRRSHGEYVLIGLWLESFIAEGEGLCSPEHAREVRSLVSLVLPRVPRIPNAADGLRFALLDKKNSGSDISLIVSKARGEYAELSLPPDRYARYLNILAEERA